MIDAAARAIKHSYYEANARRRVVGVLDPDSFEELLPPRARAVSPHLETLGTPWSFDDGVMGSGGLAGRTVLITAQEGDFMGGAVGEVHGAKITGLLERAVAVRAEAVLLLVESGRVRLHEANAGLIAVSEIIRAVLATRAADIPVIALIGGRYGCFGGMGIVARCCDTVIVSEEGRLALSGPEVIETVMGVEEFDSRDRALVCEIHALADAQVRVMNLAARARITKFPLQRLEELSKDSPVFAPGVENYLKMGGVHSVWGGELAQHLVAALRREAGPDRCRELGFERKGRELALGVAQRVRESA